MHRDGLRDDEWDRIKDFLPGRKGHVWKRPLPDFIAALYVKRFGKPISAVVKTIEEIAAAALAKKRAKKTRKLIASQPPNEQGSVAQTE